MLILNTPTGDRAIAKGNIHTIHADYEEGFIYVTANFIGYPFRSINGIKVKDQIHALRLVNEFADEHGETAVDFPISEETKAKADKAFAEMRAKAEENQKQLKGLTLEELDKMYEPKTKPRNVTLDI